MKTKLLLTLSLLIGLLHLGGAGNAAANNCYLLDDTREYTIYTIGATQIFEWESNKTPDMLYFTARKTALGINYFFVEQRVNGVWSDIANPSLGSDFSNYAYQLNPNATAVRFYTAVGATLNKHIKNIKVTLKNSLSISTT